MTSCRNLVAPAIGASPALAFAAAPVYFDLGGLIFIALAAVVGLVLLLVSLARRSRALAAIGLALIVVPSALTVTREKDEHRKRDDAFKVVVSDEKEHRARFAAFCNGPRQPVRVLSEATARNGIRPALMVKCSDDRNMGLCYALNRRLESQFVTGGPACGNTSVGAVWLEIGDREPRSVVVPVCGAESRDAGAYATHHLSTRVLRSEYADGKGPMSRAHFFELELTLIDAADARPLAAGVFFRSVNAGNVDYDKPPMCPSFEHTAVELAQAVLQRR